MSFFRNIFFLFCFATILFSCKKLGLCEDEKLSFNRRNYNGSELRVDGYFYSSVELKGEGDDGFNLFVLYRNGVFQKLHSNDVDTVSMDQKIDDRARFLANNGSVLRESKDLWGVYSVKNKKVKIETWPVVQGCKPVFRFEGQILNDTTILFMKRTRIQRKKEEENPISKTFHFREYSPKPDSTNEVID